MISIALCTYNGGTYLTEQLESIAGQTLPPDEVVVCDDGSTDDTLEVIEAFSGWAAFPVRLYRNPVRLGAIANYSRAVGLCRGDYVSLCDQDDRWYPDKLELTMKCMSRAEESHGKETALLVHSDLQVVDENGKTVSGSLMALQKIHHVEYEPLKTLLVQNFVTGCTVLLNRPLIEAALPVSEQALMHDWWFALVAAMSGRLIFLPVPTISYRQHSRNTVGAKKFLSGKNAARLAKIEQLEITIARTVRQGQALKERMLQADRPLPDYVAEYLEAALQNGKEAVHRARKHGIAKQGKTRNMIFYYLLKKCGYLDYLEENCETNADHC